MKIYSHLNKIKKTIFSFEILPPLRGQNIIEIFNTLYPLMEFNPSFINVTFHKCNELQNKYKRTGTIAICGAIMSKYEIDSIPHFLAGVFTKQITEDALIELEILEISNILILRGDIMKQSLETRIHNYSIELVKQIVDKHTSDFCIGVAGYPEKHFEAPNMEEDIFRLYEKIKVGSYFVMTQMLFDNNKYFDFLEIMRFAGLNIFIIPGIKPISSIDHLKSIPSNFYINIPTNLVKKILKSKKDIFHIGIEWAIQQSIEFKEAGIQVIHFYTMNKPDNIYQIVIELL